MNNRTMISDAIVQERPAFATRLLLLAGLAPILMMADPTDKALGLTSTQQFIPTFLSLFAGVAYLVKGVRWKGGLIWQDLSLTIIIFMIFLGGVGTAVATGSRPESFLNLSVACLAFFPFRILSSQPAQLRWFLGRFGGWLVAICVFMSVLLIFWQIHGPFFEQRSGIDHIYHEEIFILACGAIYVSVTMRQRPVLRFVLILLFFAGELSSFKNTGFLVAALTLAILLATPAHWVSQNHRQVLLTRTIGVLYLIIVAALFWLLLPYFEGSLPQGSPNVRLYTYDLRWHQFLNNPVFGLMFSGTPRLQVPLTNLYIPSHSDLLDLLAYGGAIGALAFLLPVLSFLFSLSKIRFLTTERHEAILGYTLLASVLIVWSFNPIWLQPKMGVVVWMALGIQSGLHSRLKRRQTSLVSKAVTPPLGLHRPLA
ncbi:hypothetical protein FJU08_21140 [Martelella alba]|uniref:O-antigen ligase n=1 Tax=Martelella alba TaxID=2590451 RepID=A0A506U1I5_9HYPH|nr:hypothetical protein [Martelella alba]TPW27111.1 hypothetical protein FJU08_21140 [Martelella alba]